MRHEESFAGRTWECVQVEVDTEVTAQPLPWVAARSPWGCGTPPATLLPLGTKPALNRAELREGKNTGAWFHSGPPRCWGLPQLNTGLQNSLLFNPMNKGFLLLAAKTSQLKQELKVEKSWQMLLRYWVFSKHLLLRNQYLQSYFYFICSRHNSPLWIVISHFETIARNHLYSRDYCWHRTESRGAAANR